MTKGSVAGPIETAVASGLKLTLNCLAAMSWLRTQLALAKHAGQPVSAPSSVAGSKLRSEKLNAELCTSARLIASATCADVVPMAAPPANSKSVRKGIGPTRPTPTPTMRGLRAHGKQR